VAGLVNVRRDLSASDKWLYYVGVLLTVFTIDVLKAYIAKYLSRYITPLLMQKLNRLVGMVLLIFGIRLLYLTFKTISL